MQHCNPLFGVSLLAKRHTHVTTESVYCFVRNSAHVMHAIRIFNDGVGLIEEGKKENVDFTRSIIDRKQQPFSKLLKNPV